MKSNLLSIALVILACCAAASSQTSRGSEVSGESQQAASRPSGRTSADETFDLNIAERHITEHNFAASTSVEAGEEAARGLRLRVGVDVGAEEIDVLLRNVQGHVRFRATLDRLLERINPRRALGAVP